MTTPISAQLRPAEDNATYHASTAISHTKLETFRRRPSLYQQTYLTHEAVRATTPALAFGSAFHTLVLEGEQAFAERVAALPEVDRRTKAGREAYDEFLEEYPARDYIHLAPAQFAAVLLLAECVLANPVAEALLSAPGLEVEQTFRTPPLAGCGLHPIAAQCRADGYHPHGCAASDGMPFVLDVKTVSDLPTFEKHMHDLGYYRQAAWYLKVIRAVAALDPTGATVAPEQFYFIAVEKEDPCECTVFTLDACAQDLGARENEIDLARLLECHRTDRWPGSPHLREYYLPIWYLERRLTALADAAAANANAASAAARP